MKKYEVHFRYYQYNDGRGNNGEYNDVREFSNAIKAHEAFDAISNAFKDWRISEEISEGAIKPDTSNTIKQFIPYDGYFTAEPVLIEVTRTVIK